MRKRKRARERELRYLSGGVSGGQPVQLEPLIGDNEYHLFLSHTCGVTVLDRTRCG